MVRSIGLIHDNCKLSFVPDCNIKVTGSSSSLWLWLLMASRFLPWFVLVQIICGLFPSRDKSISKITFVVCHSSQASRFLVSSWFRGIHNWGKSMTLSNHLHTDDRWQSFLRFGFLSWGSLVRWFLASTFFFFQPSWQRLMVVHVWCVNSCTFL